MKLESLPKVMKKSITYDRGTAFAHHEKLTQDTEMVTYFCKPHSPWQKGAVAKTEGSPITLTAYARYQLGEGIEIEKKDFAEEVRQAVG